MKHVIFSILFLSVTTLFAQKTETRTFDSFQGISASSSLDVYLKKGDVNEVVVKVKGYELDDVTTQMKGSTLHLGMKSGNWNGSWKKRQAIVEVTYTDEIEEINLSGSTDLYGKSTLSGEHLDISVTGSSDAYLSVDYNEISASLSGSSDIEIKGDANDLVVTASGSSDFEGKKLEVDNADLKASGSSDIYITVNNSIIAKAMSSSDIEYWGNPSQKDLTEKGAGDISRG